jgi:hypothetical protein
MFSATDIFEEIEKSLVKRANLWMSWNGEKMRANIRAFAEKEFAAGRKTIPDCPVGCQCSICLMEDCLL